LRRFERDLLDALGVGFDFGVDGDGQPLDPAARYRIERDHGPQRVRELRPGERGNAATGRALLALAADTLPEPEDLPGLRRALREAISHQLGGRGLKSWELMGVLGRFRAWPAVWLTASRKACSRASQAGASRSARPAASSRAAPTKPQLACSRCSASRTPASSP